MVPGPPTSSLPRASTLVAETTRKLARQAPPPATASPTDLRFVSKRDVTKRNVA
jgi:hypothetical protein